MRFNPKARIDSSQVEVRSGGGGGMGGFPFPTGGGGGGMKVGGGLGGVLVLVLILFLSMCTGGGSGTGGLPLDPGQVIPRSDSQAVASSELTECRTGEDANNNADCARLAVINSIQAYWSKTLSNYTESDTVIYSQSTTSGCGQASSAMGPFYCPVDKLVYLDTTFGEDMLEGQLGAMGGDFAEAYVLAHEYGHHVQDLVGTLGQVRTQQGPDSDAVRLELQADCFGGAWAKNATSVPGPDGLILIESLDQQDIDEAIDAAQAVGDDRIQQMSSGRVNPEGWTHGSAAARKYWFGVGYSTGDPNKCDTFSAKDLHHNG